jgi:hypothetical protein
MNKIEILKKLLALLENGELIEISSEIEKLSKAFYAIYNSEKKESDSPEKDSDIDAETEKLNSDIIAALNAYNLKKKELYASIKAEEQKNLSLKKEIISDFSKLIEKEDNLSKLFGSIKEIREKWNAIGTIPREKQSKIQAEYSKLSEKFSYNVDIYKELKENDLKKNYSLKNQIIHQAKALLKEKKIKEVEKSLRKLQNEWDEVGPTFKEHWEKLKEEYWSTVKELYAKIKVHYTDQKELQKENLVNKIALIEKVKEIISQEALEHKDWDKLTKELLELQKEWKSTGNVPKDSNEKIWNDFRRLFDTFFEAKSTFYEARNDVFDKKKELKAKLIEKAEALSKSTDWKNSADALKRLQEDWKKIGHAGQHAEQKLWKSFRTKCDAFFTTREEHFKQLDIENEDNLKRKEALIEKIKEYKHAADPKEALADLKTFSIEFTEIGNVPFKKKDAIYKAYKSVIDEHYTNLKMDDAEKEKILFEAKLDSLKASSNSESLFEQEKEKIRNKINDIVKEVANYENNLGFFANSKGAEVLLKGVNENIEKGKNEIDKLKRRLKLFPKE